MVRRNSLLVLGTTMAALAAASCGGSTTNTDAGDAQTGGDAGPAMTYTYVINTLTIDMDTSNTDAHTGFNLDGLCSDAMGSADCSAEDYYSAIDPDQNCPTVNRSGSMSSATYNTCTPNPNPGCMVTGSVDPITTPTSCQGCVDNQLPTLANTLMSQVDIRSALSDQINANSLAILAQVSDVNDLNNDPSITVSLFVGYPTRTTGCDSVMPEAEYVVSQSSLNAGGTTLADAKFRFTGSIVAGRIRIATSPTDTFNLPLPSVGGAALTLALHSPQLRANISTSGLALGNLGGAVNGNELLTTVCSAVPMYCSLASTAVGGLVDIQSGGVCYNAMMGTTAAMYGNLGLGLGLTGIPATIRATNPVVPAAPAGSCGASTSDGG